MSIFRFTELRCNGGTSRRPCKKELLGKPTLTDKEARKLAAQQKWRHVDGLDYCPTCDAKRALAALNQEPRS